MRLLLMDRIAFGKPGRCSRPVGENSSVGRAGMPSTSRKGKTGNGAEPSRSTKCEDGKLEAQDEAAIKVEEDASMSG